MRKKRASKKLVIGVVVIIILIIAITAGIYYLNQKGKAQLGPDLGTCVDSDAAINPDGTIVYPTNNYTLKGTRVAVLGTSVANYTDKCMSENNSLVEQYCKSNSFAGRYSETINCTSYDKSAICLEGACVPGVTSYLNLPVFTIYVSAKGNDANYGFTKDKPIYTLSRAQDILKRFRPDKDVEIRIAPGTYYGQSVSGWDYYNTKHSLRFLSSEYDLSKPPTQKVNMPVFDGNISGIFTAGFFSASVGAGENTNIEFYGLKIKNYERSFIVIQGGETNLEATWNGNNKILGCVFENLGSWWGGCNGGSEAVNTVNSRNNVFEYNSFYNILNRIDPYGRDCINVTTGENCTCPYSFSGIHAYYISSTSWTNITHNRVKNIDGRPIKFKEGSNFNDFSDNIFEGIYDGLGVLFSSEQVSKASFNKCQSANSFDTCQSGGCYCSWENQFTNNIIVNYSDRIVYNPSCITPPSDNFPNVAIYVPNCTFTNCESHPDWYRVAQSGNEFLFCDNTSNKYFKASEDSGYVPGVDWVDSSIGACCPHNSDCVGKDGMCFNSGASGVYPNGTYSGLNINGVDNSARCYGGKWSDCDKFPNVCGSQTCGDSKGARSGEAGAFGEYSSFGQVGCCGDDSGEYYVTACAAGSSCTPRCCASPDKVIDGDGLCVAPGDSGDGGNTGGGGGGNGEDCIGNWTCGEWSDCTDGMQTRECANLKPACKSGITPSRNQSCVVDLGQDNGNDNGNGTIVNDTSQQNNGGGFLDSNLKIIVISVIVATVLIIFGLILFFMLIKKKK